METQKERILRLLKIRWVCGTEFLDRWMPRYAARISELREENPKLNIRRRKC